MKWTNIKRKFHEHKNECIYPMNIRVKRLQLKSDSHVVWSLCSLSGSYAHFLVSRWICIFCVCSCTYQSVLLSGLHSAIVASFPDSCSGLFEISEPVRKP